MAENTYYKKNVTEREREECFLWFERNIDQLPKQLKIQGMNIPDLKFTVQRIIQSLRTQMNKTPILLGQFSLLLLIQERVRQTEDFKEQGS